MRHIEEKTDGVTVAVNNPYCLINAQGSLYREVRSDVKKKYPANRKSPDCRRSNRDVPQPCLPPAPTILAGDKHSPISFQPSISGAPSVGMESPSQQLVPVQETTFMEYEDGPSSPFVTEVDAQSRMASKQWAPPAENVIEEEHAAPCFTPPHGLACDARYSFEADKENEPRTAQGKTKPFSERLEPSTPASKALLPTSSPALITDCELMPPPSTIKLHATPKRSPLKSSRGMASVPRTLTRGNSFDNSDSSMSASFQKGLDLRASQMTTQAQPNVDDTCFSAFSEIPELTMFAKLGQTPAKLHDVQLTPGGNLNATPRTSRKRSSPSRSPSPTPRRLKTPATSRDGNTTFLIDFTQQFEDAAGQRHVSPGKSNTQPNLLQYMNSQRSPNKTPRHSYATPSKPNNLLNLLDFELPPAPTPRSVPTITVRELESLKSSYLSQISSLKATLSGREAEVESLKRAVGDAERRVGEAKELLREEKSRREHVEQEKADWEKRGLEIENVLNNVRDEVVKSEAEKEDLVRKTEESEKRAEDAEARAVKAEERFADALAARASAGDGDSSSMEEQVQRLVAAQIDSKIEAVSRELHAVYKDKHERKVATLKKSYESRSEKKCADLQARLAELEQQHKDLQAAKDDTFSGPVLDVASHDAELKAQLEEQKAQIARLESEMQTSQHQQAQLLRELEQERIEKGDLVAAVDEMLLLQAEQGPAPGAMSVVEDFRKSISRPSGLRAPGALPTARESKIATSGLARPMLGVGKSKMLANIERMGRTASGSGAPSTE